MSRILWSAVLTILLLVQPVEAQTEAARLYRVQVDVWPDFDSAAVLVLVTGELPIGTELPATVGLRIPKAAGAPSAVARITADGNMLNTPFEVESDGGATLVMVETPESTFRIEYYYAYQRSGNSVQFDYEWLGGTAVDDLTILFREPSQAAAVTTDGSFEDLGLQENGQRFYRWQVGATGADENLSTSFSYVAPPPSPSTPTPATLDTSPQDQSPILSIVFAAVGGLLVGAAGGWFFTSRRASTRPLKRRKKRAGAPSFCGSCGAGVKPADDFCRQCGTQLR